MTMVFVNEMKKDENGKIMIKDGRAAHKENPQTLLEVCEEILVKTGKKMTSEEILKELLEQKLYHFSDFAKTPLNTISSRLSSAAGLGNTRIYKVSRGLYAAR